MNNLTLKAITALGGAAIGTVLTGGGYLLWNRANESRDSTAQATSKIEAAASGLTPDQSATQAARTPPFKLQAQQLISTGTGRAVYLEEATGQYRFLRCMNFRCSLIGRSVAGIKTVATFAYLGTLKGRTLDVELHLNVGTGRREIVRQRWEMSDDASRATCADAAGLPNGQDSAYSETYLVTLVDCQRDRDCTSLRAAVGEDRVMTTADDDGVAVTKTQGESAATVEADCLGPGMMSVLMALVVGTELNPNAMRHCSYTVTPGRVQNTTHDGWVIVTWGQDFAAAIKTRRQLADGSLFLSEGSAKFTGLQAFNRVNGGSSTIATFVLSE